MLYAFFLEISIQVKTTPHPSPLTLINYIKKNKKLNNEYIHPL
jgi:hypothetical protein